MATKVLGRAAIVPKGNWSASVNYIELDLVHYSSSSGGDGCSYVAKSVNSGVRPGTNSSVWMKMTESGSGDITLGDIVEDNVPIVVD